MPFPSPPQVLSGPRRRSLLASAAGAALLAGASACSAGSDGSGSASTGPSLADRVRAQAARDSQDLVRRYDAVLAVHPSLAGRLSPLRAEVVRHVTAFGGTGQASPADSATASAGSAPPPTATATDAVRAAAGAGASAGAPGSAGPSAGVPGPASAGVPADEKEARAGLAAAERSLADRRTAALLDVPGEQARLLASVAAAGAAHAYLLTEGDK
nr:lipoprotein [Streptomyces sp. Xyl84]